MASKTEISIQSVKSPNFCELKIQIPDKIVIKKGEHIMMKSIYRIVAE